MAGQLEGRVVLVTGGGSGIGRGVVERFLAEGARVGVLERDEAKVADLRTMGDAVVAVEGDATDPAANERAVAEVVDAFGGLDSLVCCVGVWDYFAGLLDTPAEVLAAGFDELMAINVKSHLLAVKACAQQLVQREGTIVLTLSNAAFYPAGGGALYTASKFACRGLVAQLAYELAPKVRVNAVAPGGTPTALGGLRSMGTDHLRMQDVPQIDDLIRGANPLHVVASPADHAPAFLFLARRENVEVVTGTVINADGGMGIRGVAQLAGLDAPPGT